MYAQLVPESIEVRQLVESDTETLWRLRLLALESEPRAFGESTEEHRRISIAQYVSRLASRGNENFVVGAFHDGNLIGMAGFYRHRNIKEQHKGVIWGVFVKSSHRGRGVGRALVSAVLDRIRRLSGLEQIQLTVATTQKPARELYLRFGFQPFAIESQALRVNGEYIDEEHMVLRL